MCTKSYKKNAFEKAFFYYANLGGQWNCVICSLQLNDYEHAEQRDFESITLLIYKYEHIQKASSIVMLLVVCNKIVNKQI